MTREKQKRTRPVYLGTFHRNDRQNVILDMATCDRLGIDYKHNLVLYLTPDGQIIGKVVKNKYNTQEMRYYIEGSGEVQEGSETVLDTSWLRDGRYMPDGFLAPEDCRW